MSEAALTRSEIRLIAAVLATDGQEAAAKRAGLSVRTAQRYLARAHVQQALAAEAVKRLRAMTTRLARHAEAAVEDLGQMATGSIPATSARVRACVAVWQAGTRAIELEDHEVRLRAIEAAIAKRGPLQ
jgi:hypothetical protein